MIDVIIPAYNGHEFIEKALQSLVNQTIKDKLIVYVIDNGSTHGYKEIIEKYIDKIKIIEITIKKNCKAAGARQKGMEVSSSEYITFLDCDDEIPPKALEIMLNLMEEDKKVQVVCGNTNVNGKLVYEFGGMWGKLYRRKFIEKYNIKCIDIYLLEDAMFALKSYLLCDYDEYKKIDECVYNYHSGRNDCSTTMLDYDRVKFFKNYFKCFNKSCNFVKKRKKNVSMNNMAIKYLKFSYERIMIYKKNSKKPLTEYEYTLIINMIRKFYYKYKKEISYGNFDDFNDMGFIRFIKELEN